MRTILVCQAAWNTRRFFVEESMKMLASCGELVVNESERAVTTEELKEKIVNVEAVITGWGGTPIPPDVLAAAQSLRLIGVLGGSVRAYSPEAALARGITLCHTPKAMGWSVAELTLGLILSTCYEIQWHDQLVRKEHTMTLPGGDYELPGGWLAMGLRHSTVGIIGSGSIARHLVVLLKPFDCAILMHDPYLSVEDAAGLGVQKVALDELMRRSGILTIHAAWTPETERLVSAEMLALLPDGAIVVNTARMPILDQEALKAEVKRGRLRVALNLIPFDETWYDPELRDRRGVLLSSASATVADTTLSDMGAMLAADIARFFAGERPQHVVTAEMLPRMT